MQQLVKNVILKLNNGEEIIFNVSSATQNIDNTLQYFRKYKEHNIVRTSEVDDDEILDKASKVLENFEMNSFYASDFVINDIIGIYYVKLEDEVFTFNMFLPTNEYSYYKNMIYFQLLGSNEIINICDFITLIKLTYTKDEMDDFSKDNPFNKYTINKKVSFSNYDLIQLDISEYENTAAIYFSIYSK